MEYLRRITEELVAAARSVEERELLALSAAVCAAARIFVAGQGRSGLCSRAFANRLTQMGFRVYCVGDVTTPAIGENDLLVTVSGSGATAGLAASVAKAKAAGARIAAITAKAHSPIAEAADTLVLLPGAVKGESGAFQPMGTSFEQLSWLTLDAAALYIMDAAGVTAEQMYARHANLE